MLNKPIQRNRRRALSLGCARTIEPWIRCQRSFPAAVGVLRRWGIKVRAWLPVLAITTFLVGCRCQGDAVFSSAFWKSYKSLDSGHVQGTDRTESIQVWNQEADDKTADRESRSETIFLIFKVHIRPGFTSADCRKVIERASWLDECSIERVAALGGWVPVEGNPMFVITLFPDEKKQSRYAIYFTLSGVKDTGQLSREQWNRKGQDFLRGNLLGRVVRLRQFALCYPVKPQSKIERFTDRGVVLLEGP